MSKFTRREFMKKGAVGLGAAVAFELHGLGRPGQAEAADIQAMKNMKEAGMPHVSVKLWPGRSEDEKQRLADAIVQDVVRFTGSSEHSVSVSIEEIPSSEWKEQVYDPEIRGKQETLYKKPGYSM